jgi:hypothetical protein
MEGPETLDYLDNLSHKEEQGDAITFESEVKFFPSTLKDGLML